MKIYRVVDDSTMVLTTVNELEALRKLKSIVDKHEKMSEWGYIETETI